ncbi:MAG: hypothetical protein ABSE73_11460 [Planctomycetota bacterium]
MDAKDARISQICLRAKSLAEEIAHKAQQGQCTPEDLSLLTDALSKLEHSLQAVARVVAALEQAAGTPIQDTLAGSRQHEDGGDAEAAAPETPV